MSALNRVKIYNVHLTFSLFINKKNNDTFEEIFFIQNSII